jgi:hypothetical protein
LASVESSEPEPAPKAAVAKQKPARRAPAPVVEEDLAEAAVALSVEDLGV